MLPITLSQSSFKYGPLDIPYSSVAGAGLGIRKRRHMDHKSLLITYQLAGQPKPHLIVFGLQPGAAGAQFSSAFQAHVADRWKGEAGYFDMRTRLGLSNRSTFTIVGIIVAITLVSVVAWAVSINKGKTSPRVTPPAATQPAR